jgi:photosystem II stability/assembly factor-like uncharacterized protein
MARRWPAAISWSGRDRPASKHALSTASTARHDRSSATLLWVLIVGAVTWSVMSDWAPRPAWATSTTSVYSASKLTDVACPTVSACEAAGTNSAGTLGIVFGTADGGQHWERQAVPAGTTEISGLACPSAATCEAVGFSTSSGVALRTINGGQAWVAQKLPAGASAGAIACPTVSVCEVVGGSGAQRTTNGGASWALQSVPTVAYSLVGIACSRDTTCEAVGWSSGFNPVGVIIGTGDGGATWRSQHLPTKQSPAAISCASVSTCEIALSPPSFGGPISGQALRTTDGGSTWEQQNIVDGVVASGISCPAPGTCLAVGGTAISYVAVRTSDGGSTWDVQALPRPSSSKTFEAQAVACPSLSSCVIVGSLVSGPSSVGVAARTTDDGKTWTISAP